MLVKTPPTRASGMQEATISPAWTRWAAADRAWRDSSSIRSANARRS